WLVSTDSGLSFREIHSKTQNLASHPDAFTYKSDAPIDQVKFLLYEPHADVSRAGVVEIRVFSLTSNLVLGLDPTHNYVANGTWSSSETVDGASVTRGEPKHAIDGDDDTDFRVPYGARQPSYLAATGVSATGAVSDIADFRLDIGLGATLAVDIVHLRFTYRSASFRVQLRESAIGTWTESCLWASALGDLGAASTEDIPEFACSSSRIVKVDAFNYYFAMPITTFGTYYRRLLRITLMRDSMVDRAGDDWIMGLAAVEAYSAFDNIAMRSTPLTSQITSPSADPALAVDGDFDTYWYTVTPASSNPTYTLDLGSCVDISKVTLWFGSQAYTA
ncbi:hypothetical protein FOZ63_010521, partial [Perkinsus olseni]